MKIAYLPEVASPCSDYPVAWGVVKMPLLGQPSSYIRDEASSSALRGPERRRRIAHLYHHDGPVRKE